MGRKAPAHVHAEAMLSALLEDRPAGLTIVRLMSATDRTRAQIHTGLAHLRKVVAAKGLPPVTWDKRWGYRMLDGAGGMDRLRTGVLRDRPPPRRELHRRDPPPTPEEDPERPLHPRGHGADGCDRAHPQFLASLAGRSRAPGRRNDRSDAAESFFALLKGKSAPTVGQTGRAPAWTSALSSRPSATDGASPALGAGTTSPRWRPGADTNRSRPIRAVGIKCPGSRGKARSARPPCWLGWEAGTDSHALDRGDGQTDDFGAARAEGSRAGQVSYKGASVGSWRRQKPKATSTGGSARDRLAGEVLQVGSAQCALDVFAVLLRGSGR